MMRSRLLAQVRPTLPWILALVPFAALVAWFWTAGDGLTIDDSGLYLMHAQALLEGQPYAETNYFSSRYTAILAFQPPGLPLTLAAIMVLTGGYHALAIKVAMIVSALPFIVLPGVYIRAHARSRDRSRNIDLPRCGTGVDVDAGSVRPRICESGLGVDLGA